MPIFINRVNFVNNTIPQTIITPIGVSWFAFKLWGAGGGIQSGSTANSIPGAGGYSYGEIFVSQYQTRLDVVVGRAGYFNSSTSSSFLGGGIGGNGVAASAGSGGGGYSSIAFQGQSPFIVAGGGGGVGIGNVSSNLYFGGNGGGLSGNDAVLTNLTSPTAITAKGATQLVGGSGGSYAGTSASTSGSSGSSLQGGKGGQEVSNGIGGGGGGGGGFFGGGGGAGSNELVSSLQQEQPGGGGSGFINTSIIFNAQTQAATQNTTKTNALPPNSNDPDYSVGAGVGYLPPLPPIGTSIGGNGLVLLYFGLQTLTKYVDKSIATIGDTLTYTVVHAGDTVYKYFNAIFFDTIPSSTSFISDSFKVNGVTITGANPNPPGVNIGSIGPGNTTITFSVVVTTIPSPSLISNIGNISANTVPNIVSNTVTTTILEANLTATKLVDKTIADIGNILTYTIPIKNIGNTTATNIVFIDTIPSDTSLVLGSFFQDSTPISNSPNPPGVTLPNSIGIGRVSTITFKIKINTAPNPNPIPNVATINYLYSVNTTTIVKNTGTNIVNTKVLYASFSDITKYVDKSFADCNDILTYTIVAKNTGTVTAQNISFKDTIPNGTVFEVDSVRINGIKQTGANPSNGFAMANIAPNDTSTITFTVKVLCQ
ncbi:MAG: glycine-rich protein [Clostridium sp.]